MTLFARSLLGVVLSLGLSATASPADQRTPSSSLQAPNGVHALVEHFLTAFENLDLPAFIGCFADDATMFFPQPEPAARFDGKAAIQEHFQQVFAAIRATAKGGPPYHRLVPEQLEIRMLGPGAAIVSFHLRNEERIARRTLVLAKVQDRWLIEHLHASNMARGQER